MSDTSRDKRVQELGEKCARSLGYDDADMVRETLAFYAADSPWRSPLRTALEALDRLSAADRQLTAVLAETTRWQRDAQSAEEKSWANVYRASITRVIKEAAPASVDEPAPRTEPSDVSMAGRRAYELDDGDDE